MKKKIFLDGPRAPRSTIKKKKTVGALGTRMGRKCYTSALKMLPFNSVVVVEQFPAKTLVDAALASFPPQLHHSFWPDRAFPPTNKNRQLRRLVFLACVVPLYIVLSSYSVAVLPCYLATLLPCYSVTLLLCYPVRLCYHIRLCYLVTFLTVTLLLCYLTSYFVILSMLFLYFTLFLCCLVTFHSVSFILCHCAGRSKMKRAALFCSTCSSVIKMAFPRTCVHLKSYKLKLIIKYK